MAARCILASFALVPLLLGQTLPQRSRLSDYPVHAELPHFAIGAAYLVHDIPTESKLYSSNDYLVVDVAIFPANEQSVRISSHDFTLRMNDKKSLNPAPAQSVVASLRFSDFDQPAGLASQGRGIGDDPGIPGVPPAAGDQSAATRFPGDPIGLGSGRGPQSRNSDDPYSVAPGRDITVDRAIESVALTEGVLKHAVKGYLFFRFSGKLKSIRALDLIYKDENGAETSLTLVSSPDK